jgi:acyl dehydratase
MTDDQVAHRAGRFERGFGRHRREPLRHQITPLSGRTVQRERSSISMTCPLGHHEGEYRRATNSRGNRGAAITTRYLEDFAVGHTFGSGRVRVDKERIKTFAAEFDPQPFHLDEEAARNTIFKGLAASGVHTAALTMRLLVESELNPAGGIIGARFDELRWPLPVRPGDELRVESEVLEVRPSKSRPKQGLVKLRATTLNQNGHAVQVVVANLIVPRRDR